MFKALFGLPALFLCLSLYGQEHGLSFGVQAGPVFSTVSPDPDVLDAKFRAGFFAGANARWTFTEQWAVQGDLQFSQRGFYYETRGALIIQNGQLAIFRGRVDYRVSYLDFLPQAEFRPIPQIGIAAGPYFALRLGQSVRYGDVLGWASTDENNQFEQTDLGIFGKLSGHIGPLTLFASYLHGFANISEIIIVDANGTFLGNLAARSRAVAVGAAYQF